MLNVRDGRGQQSHVHLVFLRSRVIGFTCGQVAPKTTTQSQRSHHSSNQNTPLPPKHLNCQEMSGADLLDLTESLLFEFFYAKGKFLLYDFK